jgi:ribonuclease PH
MKTDEIVEKYLKEGHTMEEFKELVMKAPINCSMCHRLKVYIDVYYDDHILRAFSLCPACLKLLDADPSFKDKVISKILQDKKYDINEAN